MSDDTDGTNGTKASIIKSLSKSGSGNNNITTVLVMLMLGGGIGAGSGFTIGTGTAAELVATVSIKDFEDLEDDVEDLVKDLRHIRENQLLICQALDVPCIRD